MSKETINILLFVGGAEIVFLLIFLCLVMFLKGMSKKKKDRKAIETLVQNIKKNDDSRRENLLQVFSECYDLKDEELSKVVDEFISREHAFYKVMISVYLNRDATEFTQLNTQLEEVIKPYPDLALSNDLVSRSELENLKEVNQELIGENTATKKIVDQLMEEYSRSFDKDNEGVTPEALKELPGEKTETSDTEGGGSGIVESEEVLEKIDLAGSVDEDLDFTIDSEDDATVVSNEPVMGPGEVDGIPDEHVIAEPEEILDDLDLMVEDIPEDTDAEELDDIHEADLVVEDIAEDFEIVSDDNNNDLADLVAEIQTASAESSTVATTESDPVETETDVDLDLMVEETPASDIDELLAENSDDLDVEELMPEEDEDELDEELESLLN